MAERQDEPAREFRLEGIGLVAIGAIMLAAFAGAFYLGRWYERRSVPLEDMAAGASGPLSHVEQQQDPADAGEDLTFFDTLSGEGKAAEPGREAAPAAAPQSAQADISSTDEQSEPEAAMASSAAAAEEGSYYVQVFAGRVRQSAEELVRKLREQGYRVRVDSEREGQGRLYKVRVGGYPTYDDAKAVAETLRTEGHPRAFVKLPD